MVKILHIPEVKGVQETKTNLSTMLEEMAEHGKTYLVRGTHGKMALMIDLDAFRELQESYLALVGQLEARKALDKDERAALRSATEEVQDFRNAEALTSSEVEERFLAKEPVS